MKSSLVAWVDWKRGRDEGCIPDFGTDDYHRDQSLDPLGEFVKDALWSLDSEAIEGIAKIVNILREEAGIHSVSMFDQRKIYWVWNKLTLKKMNLIEGRDLPVLAVSKGDWARKNEKWIPSVKEIREFLQHADSKIWREKKTVTSKDVIEREKVIRNILKKQLNLPFAKGRRATKKTSK